MWRRWGTPQNFLLAFIDNFEKPKKSEFWKNEKKKKMLEISSFYTCVLKAIIIWGIIPEVENTELDRISLSFWAIFCLFTPPAPSNNPENQNFEKMEKASEDVTILNLCNKKHDMECDMQFLVILGYFLLFYPAVDLEN